MPRSLPLALSLTLLAAGAAGCKKGLDMNRTGYIVGVSNDIVPLDKEREAKVEPPVMNASVMIATRLHNRRVKFCSGTLVRGEPGAATWRVLTNHHCFAIAGDDGKATPDLLPEACSFTKAYFGFTKDKAGTSFSTGCAPGTLRTNFDGDLAVFSLQANPPEPHQPLELWDGEEDAPGREALIVHYPDVPEEMAAPPEGGVKLPTAAITYADCKVIGGFAVAEWDLDRTLPFSIRHTCDLIHGSSGSGLIDVKTGKLLGVNWGGIKISYDGGTRTDNVATRAKYAAAFLSFNVEEEVRSAEKKRSSQNSLANAPREGDLKTRSQTLQENAKKRCGVAGDGSSRGGLLLMVLMATPLLATLRRKRAAIRIWSACILAACVGVGADRADAEAKPEWMNPSTAWAATYLLNAAFAAEYWSLHGAYGEKFLADPSSKAAWPRAAFALASAKQKNQLLGSEAELGALLAAHAKGFGIANATPGADPALVAATIEGADRKAFWTTLSLAYAEPSPTCPIDFSDVKKFAEHQQEQLAEGRSPSAQALLKPIAGWDETRLRCLLFTLMAASAEAKSNGFEPVHLMRALVQTSSPLVKDPAVRALMATRELQLGLYPEALRALMDLTDVEPAYRLAYDAVQRVFSVRQKGKGAVALQGF